MNDLLSDMLTGSAVAAHPDASSKGIGEAVRAKVRGAHNGQVASIHIRIGIKGNQE